MMSAKKKKTDLIYGNFKKYEVDDGDYDGFEMFGKNFNGRFYFENGYGASVIKRYGSYGYGKDLFELAVLKYHSEDEEGYGIGGDWSLCYDTPITNDVVGYLTNDEVLELLERIKDL